MIKEISDSPEKKKKKRKRKTEVLCSLTVPFEIASKKWVLNILAEMMKLSRFSNAMDSLSYSEIQAAIPNISPKMLSLRIQELVEYGLVRKIPNIVSPKKVRYQLTEAGKHFVPILIEMRNWGKNFTQVISARCLSDRCEHAINFELVLASIEHPEEFR